MKSVSASRPEREVVGLLMINVEIKSNIISTFFQDRKKKRRMEVMDGLS